MSVIKQTLKLFPDNTKMLNALSLSLRYKQHYIFDLITTNSQHALNKFFKFCARLVVFYFTDVLVIKMISHPVVVFRLRLLPIFRR